ncbi:NAD-dependent epimerase/dehydratase family protein [Campylobacter devanensis]|uniref:NAD-dependent epimerase/dehydratase family protein n=1 Tax=Campylobacter devanensis TaxID=3161138 RepID=UPI000A359BEE|nr:MULTISPECIES: NAD(P)-dependent oxidoreductase [unclassified Campylobacter]
MNNNVVVFGGCGFIGSRVVDFLQNNNYNVISADIKYSDNISKNIFKKCDIMDPDSVAEIVTNANFVFNFAGFANLDDSIQNPLRTMELNILGHLNILNACLKHNISRIIYASSAYAMSDKGSFYGISKLSSEKITEEYYKKFGLKFTILRYGSVYGHQEFYNNYIYNLIKEAMLNKEIIHHGNGEEIREYIHVDDVAKLAVDIIENTEFENSHLILTGLERMKRKELFNMINEMLGNTIKITLLNDGYSNHYMTTPYSFHPIMSKKIIPNPFIDMGQGLLECMQDIERKYGKL